MTNALMLEISQFVLLCDDEAVKHVCLNVSTLTTEYVKARPERLPSRRANKHKVRSSDGNDDNSNSTAKRR